VVVVQNPRPSWQVEVVHDGAGMTSLPAPCQCMGLKARSEATLQFGGRASDHKFPAKIHQNLFPVVNNEIIGACPGVSYESGGGFDSHSTPQFYYSARRQG
jgi:hypothetical protein